MTIGTWETQGLRETITLLCGLLGGSQGQALGGSMSVRPIPCPALCRSTLNGSSAAGFSNQAYRTKNVTFSPVGHARLPIWLRPLAAKRANNQGENVPISNSTTPIVLNLVSGDS